MNDPLQDLLKNLLKHLGSASTGAGWSEMARSLAHTVATDGEPEPNADPLQRIRLEELARVAELHVANATGLPVGSGEHPLTFTATARSTWSQRAIDAYQPWLERLADAQRPPPGSGDALAALDFSGEGGIEDFISKIAGAVGPLLVGSQFGSVIGNLAKRALGQYALPIPWPDQSELLVVPQNIEAFAKDWSLPEDETELWVCVRELAIHAVLSRPHVASTVHELLDSMVAETARMQSGLIERLTGQGADPESLQHLLEDPESLLADLMVPGQHHTSDRLTAITTAVGGYVDHMTVKVATTVTGSAGALTEAWYRYRVTDDTAEQQAGALLGLDLGREQVDRGAAFVKGVVERAGEDALARLWSEERNLPTPAEIDAPGLWLERIALPELDDGE
jgi:putative hydrolase